MVGGEAWVIILPRDFAHGLLELAQLARRFPYFQDGGVDCSITFGVQCFVVGFNGPMTERVRKVRYGLRG